MIRLMMYVEGGDPWTKQTYIYMYGMMQDMNGLFGIVGTTNFFGCKFI